MEEVEVVEEEDEQIWTSGEEASDDDESDGLEEVFFNLLSEQFNPNILLIPDLGKGSYNTDVLGMVMGWTISTSGLPPTLHIMHTSLWCSTSTTPQPLLYAWMNA
ncbi:hypothetical protein CAEBREN_12114 [Caenorhabditis brenneri]|uniref:Uncharacterized protein n=1 Tax=Caenorhabditis brenneri TaxID=135651 RepID=G0NZJ4_CAEBE|nr:hypothetical protein CAEBREN_12114 [Caenorhabditis brenneri]